MRRRIRLSSALVFGLLVGCGTSTHTAIPDNQPPELPPSVTSTGTTTEVRLSNPENGVEQEFPVAAEQVWQALMGTFDDYDLEPDVIDARGRQLGVERLTRAQIAGERSEGLVRCANSGAGPSAASRFRVTFNFVSRVVPDGSGSILHTRVRASATPIDGSSIGRVACVSNGRLEQRIIRGVALKLGIQPPGQE